MQHQHCLRLQRLKSLLIKIYSLPSAVNSTRSSGRTHIKLLTVTAGSKWEQKEKKPFLSFYLTLYSFFAFKKNTHRIYSWSPWNIKINEYMAKKEKQVPVFNNTAQTLPGLWLGLRSGSNGKRLFSDRSMIKWPRTDLSLLEVLLFRAGHSSTLLLLSSSFVILMQRAPIFPPALIPLT